MTDSDLPTGESKDPFDDILDEVLSGNLDETSVENPSPEESAGAEKPVWEQESLENLAVSECLEVGQELGDRYVLEVKLAKRGTTVTWRALDKVLSRPVLVHALDGANPVSERVLASAKQAAAITDSRFLRVLDAVTFSKLGCSFVITEYAPGRSLLELFEDGPLSVVESAWITRELAAALVLAHKNGLFHLKLSPDTVIITNAGSVKIVGLMVDYALSEEWDPGLSNAEKEAIDIRDLGRLLYALVVWRWPTIEVDESDTVWGLRQAPRDIHGWLTPRQVKPGISPAIDSICDRVLSDPPRKGSIPITSCQQLSEALGSVLGTVDASSDLEARIYSKPRSKSRGSSPTQSEPVVLTDTVRTELQPSLDQGRLDQPLTMEPVPVAQADTSPTVLQSATPIPPATSPFTGPVQQGTPYQIPPTNYLEPERPSIDRRWLGILLSIVAVVMIISLIISGLGADKDGPGGEPVAEDLGPTPVEIMRAIDFDPEADGGNNEENPDQVAYAFDGKKETAWTTLEYHNYPELGKLKPGVGLIFDLGEVKTITSISLDLVGEPTNLEIYVPTGAGATAEEPPRAGISEWTKVAALDAAPAAVELALPKPAESRYVMVYFTQLPKIREARFQAGIYEVEILVED